MVEKKANEVNETVLNMVKTAQEANEKIAESAVAAQERNIKYAQSTIANGVEVLKSQAENVLALMQSAVEQSKKQPGGFQNAIDSAIAAQEQYLKYPQGRIGDAVDVLKSHAGGTQARTQE